MTLLCHSWGECDHQQSGWRVKGERGRKGDAGGGGVPIAALTLRIRLLSVDVPAGLPVNEPPSLPSPPSLGL